jgi:hypothetical protein
LNPGGTVGVLVMSTHPPAYGHMADERTYSDDEVTRIFDLAASPAALTRPAASDEAGLTLDELKAVGKEVGIEPARISEAALALDTVRGALPRGTSWGMPVSVGRIIDFPRPVTDDEWSRIVDELRNTFAARGVVASRHGVREWGNGNLRAYLEPTESGHRLRLTTRKGGAVALNWLGAGAFATGLTILTVILTTGASPVRFELPMLWSIGAGIFALTSNLLRLPRWARDREGQMEHIANRMRGIVPEDSPDA